MVTPFDDDLEVDYEGARRLATFLVAEGADGVLLGDVTGEGPALEDDEEVELVARVREAVPDAVVAATAWVASTRRTVELCKRLARAGADAVVCPVPAGSLPSQEGLREHYRVVAQLAGVPVILKNDPRRAGTALSAASVFLCSNYAGVAGHWEAGGDHEQLCLLAAGRPPSLRLWAGDGLLLLPALASGAQGLISTTAQIATRAIRRLLDAFSSGDVERAQGLQAALLPVLRALDAGGSDPAPAKAALASLGLPAGPLRLPLAPLGGTQLATLRAALEEAGDLVSRPEGARAGELT
jgi:4-hydroxy-tetrahydrodipicolinate synthase